MKLPYSPNSYNQSLKLLNQFGNFLQCTETCLLLLSHNYLYIFILGIGLC